MPGLRLRRTAPPADRVRPRVLVLTMVRDEAEMLPRWVRHYAGQVGLENLVVLDDNSTDGSTDDLGCPTHRLPPLPGTGYERARMRLVSGLAAGFLAVYDYVVFVDADEFLVADPARYADLPDLLADRGNREVLAPMTLNVVHVPQAEPDELRPDQPVLGQRRFAKFTPIMCKPSIKRVPAAWHAASHAIDAPYRVDPELYLIHLKFADRAALRRVAEHRRALVDADGRARNSSWSRDADDIVAALDRAVRDVDPSRVPEFDPREVDLGDIVQVRKGRHRSVGRGQVQALEHQPLRRVPSALLGAV